MFSLLQDVLTPVVRRSINKAFGENRLYLLDHLLTVLQTARITACNKPHLVTQAMETVTSVSDTIKIAPSIVILQYLALQSAVNFIFVSVFHFTGGE